MTALTNFTSDLAHSVLEWISGGQVALGGDAHHEERLEGHQDVLRRVPHVREEQDERLVLQVKVEVLGGRRRIHLINNFSFLLTVA